jgi:hypothetical protein
LEEAANVGGPHGAMFHVLLALLLLLPCARAGDSLTPDGPEDSPITSVHLQLYPADASKMVVFFECKAALEDAEVSYGTGKRQSGTLSVGTLSHAQPSKSPTVSASRPRVRVVLMLLWMPFTGERFSQESGIGAR